jgi:small subunit ribosomal protein S7
MGSITASREQLKGDPRYNNLLVSKFVNCLMWDGKKTTAQHVFYGALDLVAKRSSRDEPLEVFLQAVENVKPHIEVRSKRVGGAAYQVPMQVNKSRQQSLAIRWLLMAVREKKGRPTSQKLADEIWAAYNKEGTAMNRRENVHRMAEANKAFAHFAW